MYFSRRYYASLPISVLLQKLMSCPDPPRSAQDDACTRYEGPAADTSMRAYVALFWNAALRANAAARIS
jgi:hypothetical protein